MSRSRAWAATAVLLTGLAGYFVMPPLASRGDDLTLPEERAERLRQELESLQPKGTYILIDTGANRLILKRGAEVLMEAVCSTGSRRTLVSGERRWTFETPRGVRQIRSKIRHPVWRRPDWAFLEEGKPLPRREGDRYMPGVLGDYALDIGGGYFIHGTLYTRLLGQNVTHGCIRLGDEDLEKLFRQAPVGAKVYVF